MDTREGYIGLPLEVDGAGIRKGRVPACQIVEAFDVIEYLGTTQRWADPYPLGEGKVGF